MITFEHIIALLTLFAVLMVWGIFFRIDRPSCFTDVKAKRGCCATRRLYAKCNPVGRLVDKEGE